MLSVAVTDPTHLQVDEVPVKVFTFEESTLEKYPNGTVTVILPLMATTFSVVNPNVIAPVLTVLGALSPATAKARPRPFCT